MSNIAKKFVSEWKKSAPKERIFMIFGGLFLVLAIIGIFLPVVPQVPFAILAGLFFAKGNPKLHRWLRQNKHLGQALRDWEDYKVVRPKLKIFTVLCLAGGAVIVH